MRHAKVAENPRLRFTAKLWRGSTHERNTTPEDEIQFKQGIDPLVEAGRLGALLLQFPWSFKTRRRTVGNCSSYIDGSGNIRWSWRSDTRAGTSRRVLDMRL